MFWLLLVLVVVAAIVLIAFSKTRSGSKAEVSDTSAADGFPYRMVGNLFSPAERSFLGVLEQAVAPDHRVFGKVRIADVASVNSMSNRSLWQRAFNRISAKHFDFVVCTSADLSVVCAIELDDVSHQADKRKVRDSFVSGVCQAISLPFLQFPAQHAYSISDLRSKFDLAINPQPEAAAAGI
jgi:hypothetical protein